MLVLAHLRACADIWGHCILALLEEDTPTWRAVNPRTWIKQAGYYELDFQPSLDAFATQRVTTRDEILPHCSAPLS